MVAKAPRLYLRMSQLIDKLRLDRYVNANLILALDVFASVGASVTSLFFANTFISPVVNRVVIAWWLLGSMCFSLFFFRLLQTHKAIIRHSTLREVWKVLVSILAKGIALALFLIVVVRVPLHERFYSGALLLDLVVTFVALVVMRVAMIVIYDVIRSRSLHARVPVVIYGTGDKSASLVIRLQNSPHYRVVAFVNFGKSLYHHTLANYPVCYFESKEDFDSLQKRYAMAAVLFATEEDARLERDRLLRIAAEKGLKILIAPAIDEVVDGRVMRQNIREIKTCTDLRALTWTNKRFPLPIFKHTKK